MRTVFLFLIGVVAAGCPGEATYVKLLELEYRVAVLPAPADDEDNPASRYESQLRNGTRTWPSLWSGASPRRSFKIEPSVVVRADGNIEGGLFHLSSTTDSDGNTLYGGTLQAALLHDSGSGPLAFTKLQIYVTGGIRPDGSTSSASALLQDPNGVTRNSAQRFNHVRIQNVRTLGGTRWVRGEFRFATVSGQQLLLVKGSFDLPNHRWNANWIQ